MTKVVQFPKAKQPVPQSDLSMDHNNADMPRGATVKTLLSWALLLVRLPLFLVLYWLRLPVMLVCNLISGPLLLAWLFAWYAFPEKTVMVWSFATMSFAAFAVMWLYDLVLMLLSPQELIRTL
jgi:hypothetical protein